MLCGLICVTLGLLFVAAVTATVGSDSAIWWWPAAAVAAAVGGASVGPLFAAALGESPDEAYEGDAIPVTLRAAP